MDSENPSADRKFMNLALRLARRGEGLVEPNPMVGAVLVRNGRIIGKGWHQGFGRPHAEIEAISAAGAAARGSTLYVNLEPCCHTGKTGPCTEAIIAAGIRRVVLAMTDPNELVRGKGISRLRQAVIQVDSNCMATPAQALNQPFIKWITTHQPYVIAKWAQTLDGCIADRRGGSRWISAPESRELVHQLRGRMDGIMVGIGTALADNPMLTARPEKHGLCRRIATRIVIDGQCRLPLESKLVQTAAAIPTMVMHRRTLAGAAVRRREKLVARGVECISIPAGRNGEMNLTAALKDLGKRNFTNLLVEGGPKLLGMMLRENLIDQGMVFIAPKIAGDQKARHAVEGIAVPSITNIIGLTFSDAVTSGPDVVLNWQKRGSANQ